MTNQNYFNGGGCNKPLSSTLHKTAKGGDV